MFETREHLMVFVRRNKQLLRSNEPKFHSRSEILSDPGFSEKSSGGLGTKYRARYVVIPLAAAICTAHLACEATVIVPCLSTSIANIAGKIGLLLRLLAFGSQFAM